MELNYIAFIFFAWIASSSFIRFIGCYYVSRTMKVYSGFNYWTTAAFINMVSLVLFMVSANDGLHLHFLGYLLSYSSALLLPYGLKVSGGIKGGVLFPIFSISIVLASAIMVALLPFPLNDSLTTVIYIILIPIFLLCIYYLYRKDSLHNGLKKRLITTTLVLGILLCIIRVLLTIYDQYSPPEGVDIFRKQWITIFLDNNFTLIYFSFVLLNFRKLERDLAKSTEENEVLEGLLPICAECKNIRDTKGNWTILEGYISSHSEAHFSHSICPTCIEKLYPEMKDELNSANL